MKKPLFSSLLLLTMILSTGAQDLTCTVQIPFWKLDPSLEPVAHNGLGGRLGVEYSPKAWGSLTLGISAFWLWMPSSVEDLSLQTAMGVLSLGTAWYQGEYGEMGPYLEAGWGLSLVEARGTSPLALGGQAYGSLGLRYEKDVIPGFVLGAGVGLGVLMEKNRVFFNPQAALTLGFPLDPPPISSPGGIFEDKVKPILEARTALDAMVDVQVLGIAAQEGERIVIHSSFEANGSGLTPRFNQQLPGILRYLATLTNLKSIEILGYVADDGTREEGLELSLERAQVVRKLLEKQFPEFKGAWIIRGLGRANPMADNKTDAGRRLNRRIEMILHVNP